MIEMDETSLEYKPPSWFIWLPIGVILILIVGVLIWRGNDRSQPQGLFPRLSSPTPLALIIEGQPALVSFEELQADPFAYLEQPIQVTGNLIFLEPADCLQSNGPNMAWALVSSDLRFDAVNFEQVVELVASDTTLTIQGIWRHYFGPAGCGKGPAVQSIWYLTVSRIVQPNPLLDMNGQPIVFDVSSESGEVLGVTATPGVEPETAVTPSPIPTETPTVTASPTLPPNNTPTRTILASPTPENPGDSTPTVESTTVESATAIPTETNDPTVTPDGTSTVTAVPENTTQTPIVDPSPVSTGGYPGPSTPTPEPSLTPYPAP